MNRAFGKIFSLTAVSAAALSLAVAATALPARADDDAHEFREKTMKSFGGGMKVLVGYVKGGDASAEDLAKAAGTIAATAMIDANKVFFPKDAHPGEGDSKVKPALYSEWPKAEGYWKAIAPASATLTAAVASGDKAAIGAAVKGVGEACSTCHEAYRIKKD